MSDDQPKPDESAFDVASRWYNADSVYAYIQRQNSKLPYTREQHIETMPRDVRTREFSNWLTNQYRLAMAKGIEIGRRMQEKEKAEEKQKEL